MDSWVQESITGAMTWMQASKTIWVTDIQTEKFTLNFFPYLEYIKQPWRKKSKGNMKLNHVSLTFKFSHRWKVSS